MGKRNEYEFKIEEMNGFKAYWKILIFLVTMEV